MKSGKLQVIQYRKFYGNSNKSAKRISSLLYQVDGSKIKYEFLHQNYMTTCVQYYMPDIY